MTDLITPENFNFFREEIEKIAKSDPALHMWSRSNLGYELGGRGKGFVRQHPVQKIAPSRLITARNVARNVGGAIKRGVSSITPSGKTVGKIGKGLGKAGLVAGLLGTVLTYGAVKHGATSGMRNYGR